MWNDMKQRHWTRELPWIARGGNFFEFGGKHGNQMTSLIRYKVCILIRSLSSKTNSTQTSCTCTSNNWKSNHSCRIEKSMTPEHCKMLQWDYEALLNKAGRQPSSTNSASLLSSPLSDSVLLPSRSTSEDETHCSKFPPKRLDTFRNSIVCHDQSRTRLNFQRL